MIEETESRIRETKTAIESLEESLKLLQSKGA